jgi:hypothetical protein
MKLNEDLQKKLSKRYEPSSMINMKFRSNDVAFKTDNNGNAVLLFIGKKNTEGLIKGNRYTRVLKHDANGNIIKDHWEMKGRAT